MAYGGKPDQARGVNGMPSRPRRSDEAELMSVCPPIGEQKRTCRWVRAGPLHKVAAIGIGGSLAAPPTGSREAVARLPLPQNVACGFGE